MKINIMVRMEEDRQIKAGIHQREQPQKKEKKERKTERKMCNEKRKAGGRQQAS